MYKNLQRPVTEEQLNTYNTHLRNKTIARELKKKDKESTMKSKRVLTAVYDFKKCMQCLVEKLVFLIIRESLLYSILQYTKWEAKLPSAMFGMKALQAEEQTR